MARKSKAPTQEQINAVLAEEGLMLARKDEQGAFQTEVLGTVYWVKSDISKEDEDGIEDEDVDGEEEDEVEVEAPPPVVPIAAPAPTSTSNKNAYTKDFLKRKAKVLKDLGYFHGWCPGVYVSYAKRLRDDMNLVSGSHQTDVGKKLAGDLLAAVKAIDTAIETMRSLPAGWKPEKTEQAKKSSGPSALQVGDRVALTDKARKSGGYDGLLTDCNETFRVLLATSSITRVQSEHDGVLTLPRKDLELAK
jgi:hypothetical protein